MSGKQAQVRREEVAQAMRNAEAQAVEQNQVLRAVQRQEAGGQERHQNWFKRLLAALRSLGNRDVQIGDFNAEQNVQEQETEQREKSEALKGIDSFRKSIRTANFSKSQILWRVRIFSKVWKPEGNEEPEDSQMFAEQMQKLNEMYAQEEVQDPLQEIRSRLGLQEEPEPQDDNAFPAERRAELQKADKWLMSKWLKDDANIDENIVFNVLERPAGERMLIYYMIEHGAQTEIRPSFIPASQLTYQPDLEKIQKQKLDFSTLRTIYQQVFVAKDMVKLWNEAARQQDTHKEDQKSLKEALEGNEKIQDLILKEEEKQNQAEVQPEQDEKEKLEREKGKITELVRWQSEVTEKNSQVLVGMAELEELAKAYTECGRVSLKKRKLEKQMREKAAALGEDMEWLLEYQKVLWNQQAGEANFRELQHTNEEMKKIPKDSPVLDLVKIVLGACIGVVFSSIQLVKGYASMDKMTVAQKSLEVAYNGLSNGKLLGSQIAKFAASAEAYTAGVAVAGIVVGAVGAGAGTYNFVHAGIQKRRGREAFKKLDDENKSRQSEREAVAMAEQQKEKSLEQQKEDALEQETRQNITKIQERISKRNQATAGCQVISGICLMASGGCTLSGLAPVSTLFSVASLVAIAAGALVTKIMKKKESEAAVDAFFGMEKLVQQQETELARRDKTISESERKKMRKQIRQELIERLGFISEEEFRSFLMMHYAKHIYGKIQPLIEDSEKNMKEANQEEKAYLEFVGSLGLDVRQKQAAAEGKKEKSGLPTCEMIYQKLMS